MFSFGFSKSGGGKKDASRSTLAMKESAQDVIKTACEMRQQVEVFLPSGSDTHSSFFVGVSGDGFSFYLDTLIPEPRRGALSHGAFFAIVFFLNDVQYRLTAAYGGVEKYLGYESLKLLEPFHIEREQKREFYRVEPSLGMPVGALINDGDMEEDTTALDISMGGAKLRSGHVWTAPLLNLDVKLPGPRLLEDVEMKIISQGRINPDGKGRPLDKPYFVRGSFTGLDARHADLIGKYVMTRQREINSLFY